MPELVSTKVMLPVAAGAPDCTVAVNVTSSPSTDGLRLLVRITVVSSGRGWAYIARVGAKARVSRMVREKRRRRYFPINEIGIVDLVNKP